MKYVLEVASTLTDRYQTTIPKAIRGVLQLKKRGKLRYEIMSDGTVLLGNANVDLEQRLDPADGNDVKSMVRRRSG